MPAPKCGYQWRNMNRMCDRMKVGYALIVSGILFFSACTGDPYLSSYTSSKPNEGDMIGTWTPNSATLKDMSQRGGYDTSKSIPKLIVRADGRIDLLDMPDWWLDPFGRSSHTIRSDFGTWKLKQHGDKAWWELSLDLRDQGGRIVQLRGERPPYSIHFTLGDPDEGDAMVFLRTE